MQQLIHSEDVDHGQAMVTSLQTGHEAVGEQFVTRYHRKDGIVIWTVTTVTSVRDKFDKPRYAVSIVEDVTPRVRLDSALRETANAARAIINDVSKHSRLADTWSEMPNRNTDKELLAIGELQLTARQHEVLQKIAQGRSTK